MTHPFAGDTTLRDAMREYYEDNALSDAAIDRLSAHVSSRDGRPWLWAAAGAAAVVLAVALVGLRIAEALESIPDSQNDGKGDGA